MYFFFQVFCHKTSTIKSCVLRRVIWIMRSEKSSCRGKKQHAEGENGRDLPALGEKLILAVLA